VGLSTCALGNQVCTNQQGSFVKKAKLLINNCLKDRFISIKDSEKISVDLIINKRGKEANMVYIIK
jgi:hypothetical protein